MSEDEQKNDSIKTLAAIVTALGMIVLVPLQTWTLSQTVDQGNRLTKLEAWVGEGRQSSEGDALRDFGLIVTELKRNAEGIERNRLSLRNLETRP
jgi:hypothetical protein